MVVECSGELQKVPESPGEFRRAPGNIESPVSSKTPKVSCLRILHGTTTEGKEAVSSACNVMQAH
eukprot:2054023-Alexandrium_andersonii.AAC.1